MASTVHVNGGGGPAGIIREEDAESGAAGATGAGRGTVVWLLVFEASASFLLVAFLVVCGVGFKVVHDREGEEEGGGGVLPTCLVIGRRKVLGEAEE